MVTKLKNLRIDEVSTVDRGAGRGVQIVMMKGGGTTEVNNMLSELNSLGPIMVAKLLHRQVSEGAISENRFGQLQKSLARAMFPDQSEGKALGKLFRSQAGRELIRPRNKYTPAVEMDLRKSEGEASPNLGQPVPRISNPFHAALKELAAQHIKNDKQHVGKTPEQMYAWLGKYSQAGKELMRRAVMHDLSGARRGSAPPEEY